MNTCGRGAGVKVYSQVLNWVLDGNMASFTFRPIHPQIKCLRMHRSRYGHTYIHKTNFAELTVKKNCVVF